MKPVEPSQASVAQTIAHAMVRGLDRLDAQLLLLHALGRDPHDRAWLLAHDSDPLASPVLTAFDAFVARRSTGEPLAYITGHKEFFGLDLLVDARVLVPRPDTETLVEWALELQSAASPVRVVDLGTGSGAIALALQHSCPAWQVVAVDYSADALAVAQANAQRLRLGVQCVQGSWLDAVQNRYDLVVSNPPYIAATDTHLAALAHEPLQALASGADGLDAIRSITGQAPKHLLPGGWLLLEHGYDQAAAVRALLNAAGLHNVQSRRDLAGIERCSGGQWLQT